MRIFESLEFTEKFINPILTIGNYDGVHLGHRRIIEIVKEKARSVSGTSMLMTFNPHPLQIIRPERELPSITPMEQKKRLIEEAGIDVLVIVPFTTGFSELSAPAFVEKILVEKLAIRGLIIGYDFRFGRGGRGDIETLRRCSDLHDFFLHVVEPITIGGEKVGSNRIRKHIQLGEVDRAETLLGRPYMMSGRIVKGKGRGKTFDVPTINLQTDVNLIPKNGVYVTETGFEGRRLPSVTNIGYNPTFGDQERSIETFILDFRGDLYDRDVDLYFHERLRDEQKFRDADELRERIELDVRMAREYFARQGRSAAT